MASADSILLKELECPICTETYKEPKVVGSCNHSFCKNCLRTYIQTVVTRGEFPCPVCRQTCQVPPNGVDGFKSDFKLANIIEKYNDVRKGLNQMKWNKCSYCTDMNKNVEASLCCLQCDGISLCDDCGQKHKDHPRTESHDVISLCGLHGKPLGQFCTSCDRPICVVCFGKHADKQYHHVIDYKDGLTMKKDELEEGFEKVQVAGYQLKEQDTELRKELEETKTTYEEMKKIADGNIRVAEQNLKKSFLEYSEKAAYYRSQLELIERKMVENERQEKKLQEIHQPFLQSLDRKCQQKAEMIQNTIKDVADMQKEIQATATKRDALFSEKLLKADLSENITRACTRMMELSDASKQDRVTQFRGTMMTNVDLYKEYVASVRRFSSTSLSSKLEVPERGEIRSVAFMSKDRIAVAFMSKDRIGLATSGMSGYVSGQNWKISLWNLPSLTAKVIMQGKTWIPSIAALGQDNLVVLRGRSSILAVLDVVRNTKREIDMKLSDKAIKELRSVEVVNHGNFLVSYSESHSFHVALIDGKGKVLQDISNTDYYFAFCRITGMVFMCNYRASTVSCYQVGENSLTEVMSVPHGVKEFESTDICSGTFGELFMVGRMKGDTPREVRLYQADIDTESKTLSMRQIKINGVQIRAANDFPGPKCSVKGNKLVIGYDNKVHVLDLLV